MMKITLFSSTSYDTQYFEAANDIYNFEITHQAFLTREALEQIASTTLGNIKSFCSGDELQNEVKLMK